MTMKLGLSNVGVRCCGGKQPAYACGFPYSVQPCAAEEDFKPNAGTEESHCAGDEAVMDKTKWDSGFSQCPCVGSNGQREMLKDGARVIETRNYGLYPADYGENCSVLRLSYIKTFHFEPSRASIYFKL